MPDARIDVCCSGQEVPGQRTTGNQSPEVSILPKKEFVCVCFVFPSLLERRVLDRVQREDNRYGGVVPSKERKAKMAVI